MPDSRWQTLTGALECLEPVHLGVRHPYGQVRVGDKVLRGGRLLAGLASLSGSDALFSDPGAIIVEDAPVFAEGGRFQDEVFHLPLTAETCKRFRGTTWRSEARMSARDEDPRHGVCDTLLQRWAFHMGAAESRPWRGCRSCRAEAADDGPVEPHVDFVQRRQVAGRYEYEDCRPQLERRAHTAINPDRGTVEHGMLFAEDLVLPGTVFYVRIHLRDGGATADRILDWEQYSFRLGGARSRGHGLVTFRGFAQQHEAPAAEPLSDRLAHFDALAREWLGVSEPDGRICFALTLQAPLVLPAQDVRPPGELCDDWRRLFPRCADIPGTRLEFSQHRFVPVSGWSSLWQAPKPALLALAAGSVCVFSAAASLDDVAASVAPLDVEGAGCFRAQGYGALRLSDPFHREVNEDER